MKRLLVVVAIIMFSEAGVCAQTIQPVVLIQAKSGSAPGQFAIDMDFSVLGLAVDDLERIYILDDFNNRVQYYDQSGGYLGAISIIPVAPPTQAERARNPDLPGKLPDVEHMDFIDGSLYVRQTRCVNGLVDKACSVGHLLRREGNEFVNADGDKNAKLILQKLIYFYGRVKDNFQATLRKLGVRPEDLSKKFPLGDECASTNCVFGQIFIDKKGNAWVNSSEGLRVFTPSGKLIYKNNERWYDEVLSSRGNLYGLSYDVDAITSVGSLRVTKYSLQGK